MESATLQLHIHDEQGDQDGNFGIYKVLRSWNETQANWIYRMSNETWGANGGEAGVDYDESYYATVHTHNDAEGDWLRVNITDLMNEWLSGQSVSEGIFLINKGPSDYVNKYFDSINADNADYHPNIKIIYNPTPPTSTPTPTYTNTPTATPTNAPTVTNTPNLGATSTPTNPPFNENSHLLIQSDWQNDEYTYFDDTSTLEPTHTISVIGNQGFLPNHETYKSKFPPTSIEFTGTDGNCIQANDSDVIDFGTDDFTIDFWVLFLLLYPNNHAAIVTNIGEGDTGNLLIEVDRNDGLLIPRIRLYDSVGNDFYTS